MNKSMVRYLLSKLLLIESGLLLVPLVVAFIYHEPSRVVTSIIMKNSILLHIGLI